MEINPEDKQVIDLLSKLKNSSGAYPSDILASRRQNYLKQVANVGLGIGIGAAAKGSNGAGSAATATSKILEIALITSIALEAGTVAYLYREKIADAIRTYTGSSNVQEIASPSNNVSSPDSELVGTTEFPVVIVATPSGTVTTPSVTISGSALPDVAGDDNNNGANVSVNATPDPGGNNGNQYGLTPKPVRTIENNDNGGGGNGGGSGGNGGENGGGNGGGNSGGNGNNNRP